MMEIETLQRQIVDRLEAGEDAHDLFNKLGRIRAKEACREDIKQLMKIADEHQALTAKAILERMAVGAEIRNQVDKLLAEGGTR